MEWNPCRKRPCSHRPLSSRSTTKRTLALDGLDVRYSIDFRTSSMELHPVTVWPAAESREEDSLVNAARDGDRAAFGRLYDRYARMVHGILLARVPPRDADALAPEDCLSALRHPHP